MITNKELADLAKIGQSIAKDFATRQKSASPYEFKIDIAICIFDGAIKVSGHADQFKIHMANDGVMSKTQVEAEQLLRQVCTEAAYQNEGVTILLVEATKILEHYPTL